MISILVGNHRVGWYIARTLLESYFDKIGFVAVQQDNNIIKRLAADKYCLYKDESQIADLVKNTNTTTLILAWWPKILKTLPAEGIRIINTHPSLLPYCRGKHGYYWSIVNKKPFGVTIHQIDKGIDTGPILWQKEIEVLPTDTGECLYNKAVDEMCQLFSDHLDDIANEKFPPPIKQDDKVATSHFGKEFFIEPLKVTDIYSVGYLINDLRGRTFNNKKSGRQIEIDGKLYTIKCYLEEL